MKVYFSKSVISMSGYDKSGILHGIDFERTGFGSLYISKSKGEDESIEASEYFKSGNVWLESEIEPSKEEPEKELIDVTEVTDYTAAKEYLAANYGADKRQMRTPEAVKKVAIDNGVRFSRWD